MIRLRIAVPSLAVLLVALACAEQAPPDEEVAVDDTQAAAMDPTCDRPSNKTPTGKMVMISVDNESIAPDPEPVIQKVMKGAIRWKMDSGSSDYGWKVEFENEDSPLPEAVYFDSSGGTQGDTVRVDAECKLYKYSITVWPQSDPSNTTVVDPGADIIP